MEIIISVPPNLFQIVLLMYSQCYVLGSKFKLIREIFNKNQALLSHSELLIKYFLVTDKN